MCVFLGWVGGSCSYPPLKTNMAMENQPFETVCPVLNMRIFQSHVSFQWCSSVERSCCGCSCGCVDDTQNILYFAYAWFVLRRDSKSCNTGAETLQNVGRLTYRFHSLSKGR